MNVRLENLAGILNLRGKRDRLSRTFPRDVVVSQRLERHSHLGAGGHDESEGTQAEGLEMVKLKL